MRSNKEHTELFRLPVMFVRAIQQSMATGYAVTPVMPLDSGLSSALQLSLQISEEEERLRKQEEEELETVLKLSMAQQ